MTLPSYPSAIPYRPSKHGWSRKYHDPLVVTEVEDGPDISRVRSLTKIKTLDYVIHMNAADLATFETFVETTLAQGSSHFLMQVPATGATYSERRCFIKGGEWGDSSLGGGWFAVSFTLCVFPAT